MGELKKVEKEQRRGMRKRLRTLQRGARGIAVVGSSLMNEMMPTSPPGVTYIVQSRNNTTELLRLKDAKELRRLLANAVHPESSVIVRKEIDSSGFEHERKIQ